MTRLTLPPPPPPPDPSGHRAARRPQCRPHPGPDAAGGGTAGE